jgi:N6-adenosine-specific RNA methylase IME4
MTPFLFPPAAMPNWYWGSLEPHSYDLIMIDPPWRFELRSDKGEHKSAQAQYATMSLDEIKALPVGLLAKPDCLLWMWATAPMLPQQLSVLNAWGFGYKSEGVWVKTTVNGKIAFGTGYGFRGAHEPIILGQVGSPQLTHATRSVIMGLAREHSRKPDEAYAAAEDLMPGARRADVFSRETRLGWDVFGNEAGKFDLAAQDPITANRQELAL